jgi:putative addiction module component (TIGR02574 family)
LALSIDVDRMIAMDKPVADKLSDLIEAVKMLPEASQQALVEEFSDRLADFTDSRLSDAQRAEVDRRLAALRHADPEKVDQFFAAKRQP